MPGGTTGTLSFVSVIANVVSWFPTVLDAITRFLDQVRIRLISQLIKGISRVFQKLLTYFNGTNISKIFTQLAPVTPVIFCSYLNDLLLWLTPVKSTTASTLFKNGLSL